MSFLLTAAESGAEAVQPGLINGAGLVIGIGGLLLVAAWWAYLYR